MGCPLKSAIALARHWWQWQKHLCPRQRYLKFAICSPLLERVRVTPSQRRGGLVLEDGNEERDKERDYWQETQTLTNSKTMYTAVGAAYC